MSELPPDSGDDNDVWLVDPEHPALANPAAARIDEDNLPDRLAWNTFQTLAEFNSDVWVPAILEDALEADLPIVELEWGDATVELWATGVPLGSTTDIVITGPEALVLVEAGFQRDITVEHLMARGGEASTLAGPSRPQAAFVAVTVEPPPDLEGELEDLLKADIGDAVLRFTGVTTWAHLGSLALDLAEEADPLRAAQVHRLVTELQRTFPGIEV
jgi:hypothetical protein